MSDCARAYRRCRAHGRQLIGRGRSRSRRSNRSPALNGSAVHYLASEDRSYGAPQAIQAENSSLSDVVSDVLPLGGMALS